jgi:hypothetical protein
MPKDERLWTEPRGVPPGVNNATPHRTPNGNGTGALHVAGNSGQGSSLSNSGKELSEVQRALKEAQRSVDVAGEMICGSLDRWLHLVAPWEGALELNPSLSVFVKERRFQELADLCTSTPKLIPCTTDRAISLVQSIQEADALEREIAEMEATIKLETAGLDATKVFATKVDAQLRLYPTASHGPHSVQEEWTWSNHFTRVEGTLRSELLTKQKNWEHSCEHVSRLLNSTVAAEKQIGELTAVAEERSASLSQEARRLSQSRIIALVSLEESNRFRVMDEESSAALLLWDTLARSIGDSLQAFDVTPSQSLESEVVQMQQKCDTATAELEAKRQILLGLSRQVQAFKDEEALSRGQTAQGKPQVPTLPAEWATALRQMPPEERENHLNQWRARIREIQDAIALRPRRPPPQSPSRGSQTPSKVPKDDIELFETLDKLQSQVLHLSAELAQIQREQQRCEGYQSIELYHDAQKALMDLHTTTINPLRAELSSLEQESKGIKKDAEGWEVERALLMQTEASRRQAVDAKRSAKYALEDDIQQLEGTLNGLQSRRDRHLQKKKFYFAQMSRPDYMHLPSRSRNHTRGSSADDAQGDSTRSEEADWGREEGADVDQSIEIVDGSPVAKVRGPWSSNGADFDRDRPGQISRRLSDQSQNSTSRSSASVILGAAAWLGSTVASLWSKKAK